MRTPKPKTLSLLTAIGLSGLTPACLSVKDGAGAQKGSSTSQAVLAPPNTGGQTVSEGGTLAMRQFDQAMASIQEATGVDPFAIGQMVNYYREVSATLPLNGGATEVTGANLMAITSLSSFACLRLIDQVRAQLPTSREIFRTVNFAQGPATALTAPVRDSVITDLFGKILLRTPSAEEMAIGRDLLNEAVPPNSALATDTQLAVRTGCAWVLSSPEFWTI